MRCQTFSLVGLTNCFTSSTASAISLTCCGLLAITRLSGFCHDHYCITITMIIFNIMTIIISKDKLPTWRTTLLGACFTASAIFSF